MKNINKFLYFVVITLVSILCAGKIDKNLIPPDLRIENNPYVVNIFTDESGRKIAKSIFPVKPPNKKMPPAQIPDTKILNGTFLVNSINNVPAFTWCYGCVPTSAAMMMGYYDNNDYPDMYTGPANGGVCPMNNVTYWGSTTYPSVTCGECPLSASHNGIDGRTTRGSVDDYWIDYRNNDPDPYITGGWTEHTADSLADFMGTSQSKYDNIDGNSSLFWYLDGSPMYDCTSCEPDSMDSCHGIKVFVESRGYSIQANGNFTQLIYGYDGNTKGFTFDNYKTEIDAGRPVLIVVEGHVMLGVGYDDSTQKIYIHDTWDHDTHEMDWGGKYSGMQHFAVTVIRLAVEEGMIIEKLKGKVDWNKFPGRGSVKLLLSLPVTISDLSFLDGCSFLNGLISYNSGSSTIYGSSGDFVKMNKSKTVMKFKSVIKKDGEPTLVVKTILKLKKGNLSVFRFIKNGYHTDSAFNVTNSDSDGWQNNYMNITLNISNNGTTINDFAGKSFKYKTKKDKKTVVK